MLLSSPITAPTGSSIIMFAISSCMKYSSYAQSRIIYAMMIIYEDSIVAGDETYRDETLHHMPFSEVLEISFHGCVMGRQFIWSVERAVESQASRGLAVVASSSTAGTSTTACHFIQYRIQQCCTGTVQAVTRFKKGTV